MKLAHPRHDSFSFVYSGSEDGRIIIWDLNGRIVQTLKAKSSKQVASPFHDISTSPSTVVRDTSVRCECGFARALFLS
jgi:hypothetical protein